MDMTRNLVKSGIRDGRLRFFESQPGSSLTVNHEFEIHYPQPYQKLRLVLWVTPCLGCDNCG
jgi:hypothetical protein